MTSEENIDIQNHNRVCVFCNPEANPLVNCIFCGKPATLKTLVKVCPDCVKGATNILAQEIK